MVETGGCTAILEVGDWKFEVRGKTTRRQVRARGGVNGFCGCETGKKEAKSKAPHANPASGGTQTGKSTKDNYEQPPPHAPSLPPPLPASPSRPHPQLPP